MNDTGRPGRDHGAPAAPDGGTSQPRDDTWPPVPGVARGLAARALQLHDIEVIHGWGVPYPCLKHRVKPVLSGQQKSAPLRHGSGVKAALSCADGHTSWSVRGAGDRDRTGMASLEGWGSTIELHPHAYRGSLTRARAAVSAGRRPRLAGGHGV